MSLSFVVEPLRYVEYITHAMAARSLSRGRPPQVDESHIAGAATHEENVGFLAALERAQHFVDETVFGHLLQTRGNFHRWRF